MGFAVLRVGILLIRVEQSQYLRLSQTSERLLFCFVEGKKQAGMRVDGAIAEGSEENASMECCFKSTLGPEYGKSMLEKIPGLW